jgi:hypothetical protein
MYAYLYSLDFNLIAEDTSNKGRIDITLFFTSPDNGKEYVYIFEFKVIKSETATGTALQQIRDRNYRAKYENGKNIIFSIGIEFSQISRNIVGFEWE